jgi:hypothetical protein
MSAAPGEATQSAYFQALQETGATGLEPATSGVTARFEVTTIDDDERRIALFMRLSEFLRIRFRRFYVVKSGLEISSRRR